jgi:hypothetical protein
MITLAIVKAEWRNLQSQSTCLPALKYQDVLKHLLRLLSRCANVNVRKIRIEANMYVELKYLLNA